jgi:hypothetical protein
MRASSRSACDAAPAGHMGLAWIVSAWDDTGIEQPAEFGAATA